MYNDLTVEPVAMAPDIKIKIEKALERAAEVDAQRITVEAHDHKVILRGKVTTWGRERKPNGRLGKLQEFPTCRTTF